MSTCIALRRGTLICSKSKILQQQQHHKVNFGKSSPSSVRHVVTSTSGAILGEPIKVRFGLLKVLAAVIPGILLGATAAKKGATWLEENEIFIPDDDEDE